MTEEHEYPYRLDFYWRSISLYAIALIVYGIVRGFTGGLTDGKIHIVLLDPVLLLLLAFVLGSSLTLFVTWLMRRSIVITDTAIEFRNRFRNRHFLIATIEKIQIGREKVIKVRGTFKIVKIRLSSRRRLLRIRTSSFHNEAELMRDLRVIQHNVKARDKRDA